MILNDSGYTTYFDKECTFVREGMKMFLVSTKENEYLVSHKTGMIQSLRE